MMPPVSLIQTAPADQPGSMRAYGDMVEESLCVAGGNDIKTTRLRFFSPRSTATVWEHHRWRFLHAGALFQRDAQNYYHLLDGSMAAFVPRAIWPRLLVTVHDLIPFLQWREQLPGPKPSVLARAVIYRTMHVWRHCLGICADSHSTRRDVEMYTGRTNIRVIPLAIRTLASGDGKISLPARFILHIGNNAAYKNRSGVIEVFRSLVQMPEHKDLHLIMAGPSPAAGLSALAASVPNVRFVTDISDAALNQLYNNAQLLLFPSMYEGFGMPVLEAMAAGCPVVCSNAGSLVEVAGDAALIGSALDPHQLVAHCNHLLTNPAARAELIKRGKVRALQYTHQIMGRAMIDWYHACITP